MTEMPLFYRRVAVQRRSKVRGEGCDYIIRKLGQPGRLERSISMSRYDLVSKKKDRP